MYGKSVGVSNIAGGVAVLPHTGNNRVLFAIAISLVTVGLIVLAASVIVSRKQRVAAK